MPYSTRYNEHVYTDFYEKVSAPWRKLHTGSAVLTRFDDVLRTVVASAYCIALLWLLLNNDGRLLRAVAVPGVTFVLATALRAALDKPRPYESFPIKPLIAKDTHGKSMPSRHMTSASVIAATLWWINPLWGAVGVVLAVFVGYARIAGGVHFPRDIAAGAALGVACALVGFVLVP